MRKKRTRQERYEAGHDTIKMQRVVNFTCDEKIADAIIKLHDKGYYTVFSCSGHLDEEEPAPYISFERIGVVGLAEFKGTNGEPKKWIHQINGYYCGVPLDYIIRREFTDDELKSTSLESLIDMAMSELNEWIDSLPHNRYDNYTTGTLKKIEK